MRTTSITGLALAAALATAGPAVASEELELVRYMSSLQYFAHKSGLAIAARNRPLAGFYVHEMEEVLEQVEEVESYDGHPVGALADSIIMPAFERLEDAVKEGDWHDVSTAFEAVVGACNECHQATGHEYIHIERRDTNPYMQSFEGGK